MSETAIAAESPAADVAVDGAAPEAPQQTTAEWLRSLDDGEPVSVAGRDPATGRFVSATEPPVEQAAGDPAADTTTDPSAAVDAAASTDEAPADEAAAEPVKIALPDFLHSRFGAELTLPADMPPEAVELVRWASNNAVRSSAVQETQEAAQQLYARLMQEAARADALEGQLRALPINPEYDAAVERIAQVRMADPYLADLMAADLQRQMMAPVDERMRAAQEQYAEEAADAEAAQIAESFVSATTERYGHWSAAEHRQALAAFATQWDMGPTPDAAPTIRDYAAFADRLYVAHPAFAAQQQVAAEAERQRIAQEAEARGRTAAAEAQRKQMEAAAAARGQNPLGRMQAATSAARIDAPTTKRQTTVEFLEELGIR